MTEQLKALALAARNPDHNESEAWYPASFVGEIYYPKNAAYIAAASPDVVLGLLEQIENYRAMWKEATAKNREMLAEKLSTHMEAK